jgi:tRNA 5-methylaminomethyl-2-thiouridine biosynthesis bifunctional protein
MEQAKISWQQNQPFSDKFDDVYFSREGGIAETEYVFLQQNHLPELWQGKRHFIIAETGFGTGLNFLTTVMHWLKSAAPSSRLHFISVEKHPLSRADLQQALSVWPELNALRDELLAVYPPPLAGYHQRLLFDGRVSLQLLQGDVLAMLSQLQTRVDVWYLDGFVPQKNPAMWSAEVFAQMARLSHQGSRFSTYTAAGFVRRGLQAAGFEVKKVPGFGRKREMLSGCLIKEPAPRRSQPWYQLAKNNLGQQRVAVIGAGVVGVATAWTLAQQGWQVELIDKHVNIASAASGNPVGVVMPRLGLENSAQVEFYTQAYCSAVQQLDRLSKQPGGEKINWRKTGVIQLPSSARIKKHMDNIHCFAGLAELMDAKLASHLAGLNINDRVLFYPAAGYVSPQDLCQLMLDAAADKITLHTHSEITTLKRDNNAWLLIDGQDRLRLSVDAVVLANAAAVNMFQQTQWLNVQCVRGQISYLPSNALSRCLRVPVCYKGYILPEYKGQHIIGATFSVDDCATEIRAEDHQKNIAGINNWFADLFNPHALVNGRAAIRAVSGDRMPIVGPVANMAFYQQNYNDLNKGKSAHTYVDAEYLPGLFVNVAHGSRGLTSAFLAAQVIAAQLTNLPLPVTEKSYHALHPSRFIVRNFKKGLRVL